MKLGHFSAHKTDHVIDQIDEGKIMIRENTFMYTLKLLLTNLNSYEF